MVAVLSGFAPGRRRRSAGLLPGADGSPATSPPGPPPRALPRAQLPALLHVDTGMARLGLDAGARRGARRRILARLAGIDLRYVMTHLACAEEPDDPLNAPAAPALRRSLRPAAARRRAASPIPPASSSAPGFGSDLARPGCALYGINPTPGAPNPMRPVVTLRARGAAGPGRSRPGRRVGYNATWTAARPDAGSPPLRPAMPMATFAPLSGRAAGIL